MKLLIVEDEVDYATLLKQRLARKKINIDLAHTIEQALDWLGKVSYDVILLDQRLPDGEGLSLLTHAKETDPFVEVVVLTGHGSLETAIQSIKQGAYDYLTKPCNTTKLEFTLTQAYEKKRLAEQAAGLSEALRRQTGSEPIIGQSPEIKGLIHMVEKVKDSEATILVLGESGSGKELIARSLHFWSTRKDKPFQALNCAALPNQLVESELFGHEKGAFTGATGAKMGLIEIAEGGTLFLDEIAEMELSTQAKLLRLLEYGEYFRVGATRSRKVKLRVVAATNKKLEEEVAAGRFREDLYHRLNVVQIEVPPLRNHREDIPLLADYLLTKKCLKNKTLSPEALGVLLDYDFPGNVRELANILERGSLLSYGSTIEAEHLFHPQMKKRITIPKEGMEREVPDLGDVDLSLANCERQHILKVLKMTGGNKTKAAQELKIGLKTLYRKVKEYGIESLG
ncbi:MULTISPECIES: sigma-54 dependent transcriptional regulator [Desulfitobacterium]|uniref:Stage 0 sporulation protein A homolog n=1 Tax=Desulfitobacterium dehalogenans (strain ATCC 51507 / DSM 9161 / JW/IU-DC1) TaxID=756499 RepID=I4A4Q1_DESDJ|nr:MULTISPECIES: sigma-54 dependent transcriptional regulator [Desulfitobacterium]AFL98935.1 response regulator with CheY-like receiver, AAA-type ATPase, and DNA-binding domains [Desulfitobacterium dehalogenans ATCC 51507]